MSEHRSYPRGGGKSNTDQKITVKYFGPDFTAIENGYKEANKIMTEGIARAKSRIDVVGQNGNDGLHYESEYDNVEHPKHYTMHPSGIECIQITEYMGFNLGNAVKYIWRADLKKNTKEDLEKAIWYIKREMDKRGYND